MAEKYVVTQKFMDDLETWKLFYGLSEKEYIEDTSYVEFVALKRLPNSVFFWCLKDNGEFSVKNNRPIAIVQWLNGEDVFEVKKEQWVVRSIKRDNYYTHYVLDLIDIGDILIPTYTRVYYSATKFESREEAEKWVVPGFEVVEV